jgi:chromosome segregation ATPase
MIQLRVYISTVLILPIALGFMSAALAQTSRPSSGANAQLMQQMQQLASERTSLQAENAKLKKELDDLRKDRDALKNSQQTLDRRAKSNEISLKESVVQRASADKELAQMKDRQQQLSAKFKETVGNLRQVESEHTAAQQTLATRDRELKVCVDRNLALYKLNAEVLTRLEHHSVWARAVQTEPFTKIKRVQLENMVDEYKSRAEDQRAGADSQPAGQSGNAQPATPGQTPPH